MLGRPQRSFVAISVVSSRHTQLSLGLEGRCKRRSLPWCGVRLSSCFDVTLFCAADLGWVKAVILGVCVYFKVEKTSDILTDFSTAHTNFFSQNYVLLVVQ